MTVKARKRKKRDETYVEYAIYGTYPNGEVYGRREDGALQFLKSPISSITETERWATAKEKEMLRAWEEGRTLDFKAPTLQAAYDEFIEWSRLHKSNAESTLEWKREMWKVISEAIPPTLLIDKIDDACVSKLLALLTTMLPKSRNNVISVLMGILRLAHKRKKLIRLPSIEMMRVPERAPKFFHMHEFDAYLEAARDLERDGHWQSLAIGLLGGSSGLRRGEMRALHKASVDHAGLRITVEYSMWKKTIKPTKGKRFRVVGMTEELSRVLKRNGHLRGPLVFYTAQGKPCTVRAINYWFDMACKRAGLTPKGKLHVLRHTFGSHQAMAGEDMHRIQQQLGHEDQKTTQIYARLAANASVESVNKLEKFRASKRGQTVAKK